MKAQGPSRTCNESKEEEEEDLGSEVAVVGVVDDDVLGRKHRVQRQPRRRRGRHLPCQREFFIDNLLVRIHFIIVMIRWTGLAPWEFEYPFPGSLASTCRATLRLHLHGRMNQLLLGNENYYKNGPYKK